MNTKLLGLIVGVMLGGQLPALAASTTYNYVGQTYDQNCGCDQSYAAFGSRILGTVTFNFDTSCVSGYYQVGAAGITNIKFKSGIIASEVDNALGPNFLMLQNGEVVFWSFTMAVPSSRSLTIHLYTEPYVDEVAFGEPFISEVSVYDTIGRMDT